MHTCRSLCPSASYALSKKLMASSHCSILSVVLPLPMSAPSLLAPSMREAHHTSTHLHARFPSGCTRNTGHIGYPSVGSFKLWMVKGRWGAGQRRGLSGRYAPHSRNLSLSGLLLSLLRMIEISFSQSDASGALSMSENDLSNDLMR